MFMSRWNTRNEHFQDDLNTFSRTYTTDMTTTTDIRQMEAAVRHDQVETSVQAEILINLPPQPLPPQPRPSYATLPTTSVRWSSISSSGGPSSSLF